MASLFWGIPQPLFFNQIRFIPAIEIAIHRGLWSFVLLLIIFICFGKIKDFLLIFGSYKKILILSITATLISINWTGFILAVSINRVQDASMGYYITPMISIALGYFFLKEKISMQKLISIILMFFAIIYLIISLKTIPFIAILIGTTWAIYGLLRKQINDSSEVEKKIPKRPTGPPPEVSVNFYKLSTVEGTNRRQYFDRRPQRGLTGAEK